MEDKAGKMESDAVKLDKANKDGGDKLRERAAYLREGAKALKSDGSDGYMANAVDQKEYEKRGSKDGAAYVAKNSSTMVVNLDNKAAWAAGNTMAKHVIGHESLHSAGLNDYKEGKVRAYKFGEKADRDLFKKIADQPESHLNPDHIMDEVY